MLLAAVCLSLASHLCGVVQNLPFAPESDEAVFVERAAAIARTGSLNPGWFGHPGSRTIYPLAALFRAAAALHVFDLAPPGWWGPRTGDSDIPPGYYLLGRLLSVLYGVMSVPLVYLVGRRAFGARVGLAGAWLFSLCPLAVQYGRIVRSDSAALFFGMLALVACLGVYDRPGIGRRCLAGACIGLGIASRYFMVVLIPVLLMVDAAVRLRRGAGASGGKLLAGAAAGLLSACTAFALSTPYFFIDFTAVRGDLAFQANPAHLGYDGLGFAGNLA